MSVSGKAKKEEGIINTNNNVGRQLDVSPLSRGKREIETFCIKSSNIGRKQIVLDAHFDALHAGLEERASLEPDPGTEHRRIALADRLEERGAGAEFSEDREGTGDALVLLQFNSTAVWG